MLEHSKHSRPFLRSLVHPGEILLVSTHLAALKMALAQSKLRALLDRRHHNAQSACLASSCTPIRCLPERHQGNVLLPHKNRTLETDSDSHCALDGSENAMTDCTSATPRQKTVKS